MGKIAFLFPGQSSQYVGMGKELYDNVPACRDLFDRADEIAGCSITGICFEGPLETLNMTVNTQPCILTTDYAAYLALTEQGIQPDAIAGFSLGEFAALVAAGVCSYEDAMAVVKIRAKAMQEAVPLGQGAMVAVVTEQTERAIEICKNIEEGYIDLSNRNTATKLIFAGEIAATKAFQAKLDAEGIKNKVIPVSIPSHCQLMAPAQEPLRTALAGVEMSAPNVDFYMCASGAKETEVEQIREKAVGQLCAAVQCETIINNMMENGIDTFIEIGPGLMYSKFVREIAPEATLLHVEDMATLRETVDALKNV